MELTIFDIIQQTLMVSGFVLFMMLIIEYINVKSKGNWSKPLKKSKLTQLFVSSGLGIIPGCVGGFTVVSLYSHNIINFAALLTATIVSLGDEAFIMLTMIPSTAIKLTVILIILGLVAGWVTNLFLKNKTFMKKGELHLQTHEEEKECINCVKGNIFNNLKRISLQRASIISVILLVLLSQFIGFKFDINNFDWEIFLFFVGCMISLYIVAIVPHHFLEDHLWEHVIKKHFPKIFLWTFASLTIIALIYHYFDIELWVHQNLFYVLLISVIIGIIPISGPHIIFITLFASGTIPFSILLANSLVQEGHTGLPLIAESKRSFLAIKIIKISLALIIGTICYYMGW